MFITVGKYGMSGRILGLSLLAMAGLLPSKAYAAGFVDPLDEPAVMDNRATREPLLAVTNAGNRLVAVGLRGLIIYSDDRGVNWHQADVPVQSDLTSVDFLDAKAGWASGHNGVILHTQDGGVTWIKQFDGRDNLAFKAIYQKRVEAGDVSAKPYVQILDLNTRDGPSLPSLGVWFENANDGYAVGPYGMIMASHDGGTHWLPWLDHIDNPNFLYLNSVTSVAGEIYITGEKGKVYKLDRARQYFVAMDTKYAGSFFGITGKDNLLLVYGLLGHLYRSVDSGASWQPVTTGLQSTISDAVVLADGRIALASQSGQLLVGNSRSDMFKDVTIKYASPFSGIAVDGGGKLAMVGPGGVAINQLP